MASATIVKIEDAPVFGRGDGVLTTLLVGKGNAAGTVFTSSPASRPGAARRSTATTAASR